MSIELKLKKYTAEDIARITGGRLENYGADEKLEHSFISTDSRDVSTGVIFCAIKGENVDGNDYIKNAAELGCDLCICQYVPEDAKKEKICAIIVEDTIKAIGDIASDYRNASKAKFIGVTGSVGKTTTKEFIYAVASSAFKTHKTQGNYNNTLGLPLTIFGLEPDDEVAVLEMGMSELGEIEYMSRIARPDLAVITTIGTSHLASLGTRENICKAKMEIRYGLSKEGTLLLNGDDPYLTTAAEKIDNKVKFFGLASSTSEFRALNIRQKDDTSVFDLLYNGKALTNVEIPVLGKHNVGNALAAFAVGTMLGLSDEQIRSGLMNFVNVDKRQKIYSVHNITVIDDCYNASPESMRAAIDVLTQMALKKKALPCALLGDMLELGDNSRMMHDQIGQYAAQMGVQKLFCYGMQADTIAEAAIRNGIRADNVFVCLDKNHPEIMADMINGAMDGSEILLVKASRGVKAENVIECLKKIKVKK